MNFAIFGGTFDPIHRGHVAVARAAQERYQLKQILFVPSGAPPHKRSQELTPFHHRYAMVALAVEGEKTFIPSLIEDPESIAQLGNKDHDAHHAVTYSIDTVRRVKRTLKPSDKLFFIVGIDAFLDIAKWREPEALMRVAEFIVASRPGYSLADIAKALPESIRPKESVTKPFTKAEASGDIMLGGILFHLLPDLSERASATQIRAAAKTGRNLDRLVGPAVADYIRKTHLYREASSAPKPAAEVALKQAHEKATAKGKVVEITHSKSSKRRR